MTVTIINDYLHSITELLKVVMPKKKRLKNGNKLNLMNLIVAKTSISFHVL